MPLASLVAARLSYVLDGAAVLDALCTRSFVAWNKADERGLHGKRMVVVVVEGAQHTNRELQHKQSSIR